MFNIILDGKEMKTREGVHLYIKNKFGNPQYYGNNLDALWDVLCSYRENINIKLIDKESLIQNLGDYGYSIIELFQESEKENENIVFEAIDSIYEHHMKLSYYIIKETDYIKATWSGGETTQIMIYPPESNYTKRDFNFRISSATVDLDRSNFTDLEGIYRFITPLNTSLMLTHDKINFVKLKPFEIYGFSGEIPTESYGKVIDFNLMLGNNSKGRLKSVDVSREVEIKLFEDEVFKFGNENFETIFSPDQNLEILFKDEKIKLEKMNTLVLRANVIDDSISISINCKKNANILIAQISVK